jgi:tetratricopeptide (TPR) repeat protein
MGKDTSPRYADESDARMDIERNPQNAQAHYNLGQLLAQDPTRISEAEAGYRQAIELEPNTALYVYRLGLVLHEKLQSYQQAEDAYRRAIALAPDDAFFYGGLVSLLMQQSRRAEALALSAQMRSLLNTSENWYGLATLDSILGNVDAAIEHLRKAASRLDFSPAWARSDADLAAIRGDPRFDEIVDV